MLCLGMLGLLALAPYLSNAVFGAGGGDHSPAKVWIALAGPGTLFWMAHGSAPVYLVAALPLALLALVALLDPARRTAYLVAYVMGWLALGMIAAIAT